MAFDSAFTPNIVHTGAFIGKTYWAFSGADADASTAIDIIAAPGVGKSLYITGVIMQTSYDADAFPRLQDGDGTALFGPWLSGTLTSNVISWKFENPIKVASNKSLAVKCAAAGTVCVYVEGFTAEG